MKKNYENPEMKISFLSVCDVIATSNDTDPSNPGENDDP